ncbi:MAG: 3'-5' exonuclease, partial [Gammaproteobacteria bacterium]|nr:3'-5' exonuclease [Gammaproteobacteria bacterium]
DAELARISRRYSGQFACSMLAARRLFPDAPNHKLGTLVEYANISADGAFHRALFDSEMAAKLWLAMLEDIGERYDLWEVPFALIQKLTKTPKGSVHKLFQNR